MEQKKQESVTHKMTVHNAFRLGKSLSSANTKSKKQA